MGGKLLRMKLEAVCVDVTRESRAFFLPKDQTSCRDSRRAGPCLFICRVMFLTLNLSRLPTGDLTGGGGGGVWGGSDPPN